MRLVTNEPLIKRNATIGNYATTAGLVVLVGGLIVSFYGRDNTSAVVQMIPFFTLLIGFILSNLGIYFKNRYGREPRSDVALSAALKGFDDKYHLYNFYLPAPHCLIAPTGVYAITPKFQSGVVQWDGKRWKHKNANVFLSFFGQEGLANPNAEAAADAESLAKFLAKKLGGDIPPVQSLIVFYNDKATIEAENPPIPTLHAKQLKEYLRKLGKGSSRQPTLTPEQIAKLDEVLGI
jgi:hypothetical protein